MLVPLSCCRNSRAPFPAVALLALTLTTSATLLAQTPATRPAAPTAAALAGGARLADSVRTMADRAYLADDSTGLAQAYKLAQRARTVFPDEPLLLHYQGYIRYRQAQRLSDFDMALPLYEEAVSLFERSAAIRPLPETHALIASATGSMIGDSMLRGMRFGMKANAAEDHAVELGANNPRVLLLRAVSAWYKPSAFGGGEDKARDLLQQALRAFAADAPQRPLPAWGQAEAYAWLGQMEGKAGKRDAARAAYDKALSLAPDYAWVKYVLKPSLERTR
jgi:tetratricopeptide (TPR) repeat protein